MLRRMGLPLPAHSHQRIEKPRRFAQRTAGAGKYNGPAIEYDRCMGEIQRKLRMLFDKQESQIIFALEALQPSEESIDDYRGQTFERLVHQQKRRVRN